MKRDVTQSIYAIPSKRRIVVPRIVIDGSTEAGKALAVDLDANWVVSDVKTFFLTFKEYVAYAVDDKYWVDSIGPWLTRMGFDWYAVESISGTFEFKIRIPK